MITGVLISRRRHQESIQRSSSQLNAEDGSIRYIRSRAMRAGPGRFVPAGERVLSGLTLRPGLHPSPHTQPIMSFMVSSRANVGPASLISSMFVLFLSLMVTLISHLTLPSTSPPWPPTPHFLPRLPWPSICFSINCHLLISASFTLHIFSQSSPDVLFNCICPIPFYFFSFSLLLYRFVSFPWSLFHSTVCFLPVRPFPGGVNWCCNGMLSEEPSSVSVNVCQSHCWMSKRKPDFFVDIWDVIHLQYVVIWTALVNCTETSAPAV